MFLMCILLNILSFCLDKNNLEKIKENSKISPYTKNSSKILLLSFPKKQNINVDLDFNFLHISFPLSRTTKYFVQNKVEKSVRGTQASLAIF